MDKKRALGLVLRIGISVGLMVFLFAQVPDFNIDELVPDWDGSTPFWLLGAALLTLLATVIGAQRWRLVADAIGLDTEFPRMLSHYMAGQFLSNFVPTTVGGDFLRVSRLSKDTGDSPNSFTSVVFERLSGWIVLPVLSLFGLLINPGLRDLGAATRTTFIAAILTLIGLGVLILAAGNDATGRLLEKREGPLRWVNSIHEGLDILREKPREVGRILGTGFAYQGVLLLAAACAVQAIGIEEVGLTALIAFIPAVLIIQVLPLGIGGLGVREGVLIVLFNGLGVVDEQSIALGLLLYLLTLVASLFGLPALVFGGREADDEVDADAAVVAHPG